MQILLDLQGLKHCLLHLVIAPGDTAPIPTSYARSRVGSAEVTLTGSTTSRYSRYVSRNVQNIDTLLKVIMSPEEPAEDFVKHYLLLIPCQSFSDFQKVLELKVRVLSRAQADAPLTRI